MSGNKSVSEWDENCWRTVRVRFSILPAILTISCWGISMTRLLLFTLVFLSSGPTYAEWVVVREEQSAVTYIDPDTIRHKGDVVKWWELVDYKNVQTVAGSSFLSVKIQMQVDCAEELIRMLAMTEFSGNMGEGKVVLSDSTADKWEPVQPASIGHTLWKLACRKK